MTGDRGFGRGQHPEELLSASLTGDLSAAERASLDGHLAGCAQCRETLDAFAEERRLISGLREATPPRDLGARVRAGIEGRGPMAVPWWRRSATLVGAFASLATVVAAALAVVVFTDALDGPVGATHSPSAVASLGSSPTVAPSGSGDASFEPSPEPTAAPPVALLPGQLGYTQLTGKPEAEWRVSFVNDTTRDITDLGTAAGPPVAAAVSPTGEFLAFSVELGLSGANQLRVTRLADGATTVLGCTVPQPFGDRLAWSDDGHFLAYTLTPIGLGESVDCGDATGDGTRTDAWVYDAAATGEATQLTTAGNAFAADFLRGTPELPYPLLVSYAADQPYTEIVGVATDREPQRLDGVFLPLVSPDGARALFWRGQMAQDQAGRWIFSQGGMPHVSGEPVGGQPSWSGEQLFADLVPVGGAAFESGQFTWGPDSDLVAFWSGAWTGAPQGGDGTYPSASDIYVGRLGDGLLNADSRLALDLGEHQPIAAVAFSPDGSALLVTAIQPAAGDLAVPSASLLRVPLAGGEPVIVGTGAPWTGPALFGEEAVPLG